ncbi:hypothetical protein [Mycetocola sp.]|uniref:hypothetical protein n=1 Tax=Mycetocola sp. TaxID=1871042 RepID=UPI003989CBEA
MQWLAVDLAARSLLGISFDAAKYTVEPRVFTADNIADLDVSQAGWESSDWFGGPEYQAELSKLWND